MTYQVIIRNFAQISNSSYIRIQELILYSINHFFSTVTSHQKFNIEKFLESLIEGIGSVFGMLSKNYSRKLWKFVYENFTTLYIQMIVILSQKYKKSKSHELLNKVLEEIEIFQDFFEEHVSRKDIKTNKEKLQDLIKVFTGSPEEIVPYIFNLRVKLRDKFNEKCMKCLMRIRPDFDKEKRNHVYNLVKEEEEKIMSESKMNSGKMFYKGIMTEFRIHNFVDRFRARMKEKKEMLRKKKQREQDREVKTINENERMVGILT